MKRCVVPSEDLLCALGETGILPVVSIPTSEVAVPLAGALVATGVRALEVTFRTSCALEGIRRIRAAFPELKLGAGTVLDAEQVHAAKDAGADFLVTPGLDADLVRAAAEQGLPIIPGVTSPTEIMCAARLGLTTLKFFPAEISGGVAALTLYHGPFPGIRFIPTGGMNRDNIGAYLRKPFVLACGGSYMAPSAEIKAGNWTGISELCRDCMACARAARLEDRT